MKLQLIAILCPALLWAQGGQVQSSPGAGGGLVISSANPTGVSCSHTSSPARLYNGGIYTCDGTGHYALLSAGGGGGGTWGSITGTLSSQTDLQTALNGKQTAETIQTKTGNYTLVSADGVILCDATSGPVTLTLPASPGNPERHDFKKIDSTVNACTVSGNGKNLDNAATLVLSAQYQARTVRYNGVQWWIF